MIKNDNFPAPAMPYSNESTNRIYEMLFCDNAELFRPDKKFLNSYPWDILFPEVNDTIGLERILDDDNTESRIKILACNKLISEGLKPKKKELLGIVIEIGLKEGLDVLAAYKDGTARYINYTEKMIFWESPAEESNKIIDDLFRESEIVLKQIGPWDKKRPECPATDIVRISLLVSDGLYFGQGGIDVFFNDSRSAPILKCGSELMNFLIDRSIKK